MQIFKKISLVGLLLSSFLSVSFADKPVEIRLDGSSAILPLTQRAITEVKQSTDKNLASANITANGSSSMTGINSLRKNAVQIAAADWDATQDIGEVKAVKQITAYKVAKVPYVTITNLGIKVDNLTSAQLQDIFSGKIQNWNQVVVNKEGTKEIKGPNLEITVVNRALGSGTRINYQVSALNNKPFAKDSSNYKEVRSSGEMMTTIKTTPGAIGYVDLAYVKPEVNAVKFNGVAPTTDNVKNDSYKLVGYSYYFTNKKSEQIPAVMAFIKYVQSDDFQKKLSDIGFLPIK